MSIASALVPERDGKDLGFKQVARLDEVHYFRSSKVSNLAMSHCGKIVMKEALHDEITKPYCYYCEMIEQQRDERIE